MCTYVSIFATCMHCMELCNMHTGYIQFQLITCFVYNIIYIEGLYIYIIISIIIYHYNYIINIIIN